MHVIHMSVCVAAVCGTLSHVTMGTVPIISMKVLHYYHYHIIYIYSYNYVYYY